MSTCHQLPTTAYQASLMASHNGLNLRQAQKGVNVGSEVLPSILLSSKVVDSLFFLCPLIACLLVLSFPFPFLLCPLCLSTLSVHSVHRNQPLAISETTYCIQVFHSKIGKKIEAIGPPLLFTRSINTYTCAVYCFKHARMYEGR